MLPVVGDSYLNVQDDDDIGVYMFQNITVNNKQYLLFFDNGCGDLVCTHDAVTKLGAYSTKLIDGPIPIGGVGDIKLESRHGIYQITLPLFDGRLANMRGTVLDRVTSEFPMYSLDTGIETDIHDAYKRHGGDPKDLPRLPQRVGGNVDIMIGMKYKRYYPQEIFRLPSGLSIYRSPFLNSDGSRGIIGGPHPVITEIHNHFLANTTGLQFHTYMASQLQVYRNWLNISPDLLFLEPKCHKDRTQELLLNVEDEESRCCNGAYCTCLVARNRRIFDEVESAGSEISYRCVKCRDCKDCRSGERVELISTKEEVEQSIIVKSVNIDLESNCTEAILPFTEDPVKKLAPNRDKAGKVYNSVLRKLQKDLKSKQEVIAFEKKLQDLDMVDYVLNLTEEQQKMLRDATLHYYIPWRPVWNSNSISTPCRMVFDASMVTATGLSLNDVLAKGRNQMNKLVEVIIRWFIRRCAFHTDVSKMYNSLKLLPCHWMYQMYLWHPNLDPDEEPVAKVIKTLIYGVKSSGNQAEHGLRETARSQQEQYPRVSEIVQNDAYVDDIPSGEATEADAHKSADELEIVLASGGYNLKGFTFSGKPPPEHLTEDGESINVAGMRWFPEGDFIQLDIGELDFARKSRGKKLSEPKGIPERLTRKHCASKVAEVFDLVGKVTPITAGMKLDLRDLNHLQFNDCIPDNFKAIWHSHFEMMQELSTLRYQRCVVPEDAVSLDIETIDMGDASKSIACIAIYARLLRKNGEYSCQLVFARSKLIEEGTTQPRAELIAAMLNAHTGEVVRRAFGKHHQKAWKLGDNQIVLHWIHNDQKALKQWVRTRVIEICRFTLRSMWYYIESKQLIADLGTRRGVKLSDIGPTSRWILGDLWMRLLASNFPIKSVKELILSSSEVAAYQKEVIAPYDKGDDLTSFEWPQSHAALTASSSSRFQGDEIAARYEFSQYLLDPNWRGFSSGCRVMSIVHKFINNCRDKVSRRKSNAIEESLQPTVDGELPSIEESLQPTVDDELILTDEEIALGRNYFFKKASAEVKQFQKESSYQRISAEKDGILYYTGRILPEQNIKSVVRMTDVMKDLSTTSFFVPIVDPHSPVAYSVVNEIHWNHKVANHCGVETVFRFVTQVCFILNGRSLVKLFRKTCERCRYLAKRTIDIAMGPVSSQNLTIAPAFYITQLDLAGPFSAYSPHNKRTTVKIWFAVYCCSTTSTVNLKVMEDYSASGFLQSFIRFACEVGYPKILVSDGGSQLVKGYSDMRIDFKDLKNKLHRDMSVEFDLSPIGGHNFTGKVERKIQEVKNSIEKSFQNRRLSILQWETVGAEVANTINDMPLALGNVVSDFENMDILTPNRLRLGRNNERSPVGPLLVTNDPSKFFEENSDIFECWFDCWLISHVPKLMHQPKWYNTEYHLADGDIVLFLKKEGLLNGTYQYGIVKSTEIGRDQKVRTAIIRYRNHNEEFDRETRRAVRQLIVIHRVDELDIIHELGKIATLADMKMKLLGCN